MNRQARRQTKPENERYLQKILTKEQYEEFKNGIIEKEVLRRVNIFLHLFNKIIKKTLKKFRISEERIKLIENEILEETLSEYGAAPKEEGAAENE